MSIPRLGLLALAALWAGCFDDVERENPLDPLSGSFRDGGGIAGRVTELYRPTEGREGIRVRLVPVGPVGRAEVVTRTGEEGAFLLDDIPTGPYAVVVEEPGFQAASDTVMVEVGEVAETVLQLNALPQIAATSLRTVHIVRWFPEDPVFQLEVEVEARDVDEGDVVEEAALAIPTVPDALLTLPLDRVKEGRFRRTFDDSDLPGGVAGLLGLPLRIEVEDTSDGVVLSDPVGIVRVIEQSPLTGSPQLGDTTGPRPTLSWRPVELPFAFTYQVDVYVVNGAGIPVLVERVEDIPPSETSYRVVQPLELGRHSWAVWVVDAAGNRSRSRLAGFDVL